MPVFLVHVTRSADLKDALHPISESSPPITSYNPEWSEYRPELNIQPTDFLITKHQWGAFYGTELDLQLRRRGIDTYNSYVVYQQILEWRAPQDLHTNTDTIKYLLKMPCLQWSKEAHEASIKYVFPRLGLIRKTDEVLSAINSTK